MVMVVQVVTRKIKMVLIVEFAVVVGGGMVGGIADIWVDELSVSGVRIGAYVEEELARI